MGRPPGPKPHLWKHPNDSLKREKGIAWVRAKAQAHFRNEGWTLTEDEWMLIWTDDLWSRRGRRSQDLCLIRDDNKGAWSKENVMIVTRRTQLAIQKQNPILREVEPRVWDLGGESLASWQANQIKSAKYKGRYKYN